MTDLEKILLLLLDRAPNINVQAVILQSFIADNGPLSEEAGSKVREILKPKGNHHDR
jgi:hypothetical protein